MMHSTPVRTMCLGLVVGMILLMARHGMCFDEKGKEVFGVGKNSCAEFIQAYERQLAEYGATGDKVFNRVDDTILVIYTSWFRGYISAINKSTSGVYNILGTIDIQNGFLLIKKECDRHDTTYHFSEAVDDVVKFFLEVWKK